MSVRTTAWPAGTPCWVDLEVPDPLAASAFYAALFGWEVRAGPPAVGGYRMALLRDRVVAGIRPAPHAGPGSWTTYVASVDMGASAREVVAAGGRVMSGPVSLLSEGAIALAQDPTGVVFGIWEAGRLIGAELVNEPGSFCWADLLSSDVSGSRAFATQVFGHTFSDRGGDDFSYAMLRVDDSAVAGVAAIGPDSGSMEMSPQWLVYFSVDDADQVSARAQGLGGRLELRPTETPHGRMSLLRGRTGELFGVLEADDLPRT